MNTYPAMNAKIVFLLRLRDDPMSIYAATRIEELEKKIAELFADLQERDQALHVESEALGCADDRADRLERALDRACKCLSFTDCLSTMGRRDCDGECVACWKKYLLGVSNDA